MHAKLTVIYRVEPGCLGPQGNTLIEEFCRIAQVQFNSIDGGYIDWQITPRFEKNLPEIDYRINTKSLSDDKVAKYLRLIGKNKNDFETYLHDKIISIIENY